MHKPSGTGLLLHKHFVRGLQPFTEKFLMNEHVEFISQSTVISRTLIVHVQRTLLTY